MIGISAMIINVTAQQNASVPNWLKNSAIWWGEGKISDADFIASLQWLIDQKIIVIPQTGKSPTESANKIADPSFTNLSCSQDNGYVTITGKFTNNDDMSHRSVFVKLGIIDKNEIVVATGTGLISDIGPHQTKLFDAFAEYGGSYEKCEIQIDHIYN